MTDPTTDTEVARIDLADRLSRIARRTETMTPEDIVLMHRCLDLFRDEARCARRERAARGDA